MKAVLKNAVDDTRTCDLTSGVTRPQKDRRETLCTSEVLRLVTTPPPETHGKLLQEISDTPSPVYMLFFCFYIIDKARQLNYILYCVTLLANTGHASCC